MFDCLSDPLVRTHHVIDKSGEAQTQPRQKSRETALTPPPTYLLINIDGVKARVHDLHPAVLRGEDEQSHQCLAQAVEVVLPIPPLIAAVLETIGLVQDVLGLRPVAVI